MTLKNGFNVRYLFYQPKNEKIKTWPLLFSANENPNMEKALFDWPIVLQYDVKVKYRLISRKFSGTRVCIRSINKFPFLCCFCCVRAFSFQGLTKIALTTILHKRLSYT